MVSINQEAGYNMCLKEEGLAIELRVTPHIPRVVCQDDFHILTFVHDHDSALNTIHSYSTETLGGWGYKVYLKDRLQEFINISKTQHTLAVVEYELLSTDDWELLAQNPDIYMVLVTKDVTQMDHHFIEKYVTDPLILDFPLDSSAISQAMQVVFEKMIFSLSRPRNTQHAA